jgi:hypothetical protein
MSLASTRRVAFAAMADASSCEQVITALADQVVDPDAYATPSGVTTGTGADGRLEVHACALTWTRWARPPTPPGLNWGHLVLVQPKRGTPGYLIDDVRTC